MLHRTQQNIIPENQICADIKNRADRSLMQENSRKENSQTYAKAQKKFSAEHILIPMRMVMSTATATGTAIVIIVILLTAAAAMLMMRMMMLCLLPLQKGNLYLRLKFMHHPFHRFLHFLCRSRLMETSCVSESLESVSSIFPAQFAQVNPFNATFISAIVTPLFSLFAFSFVRLNNCSYNI